MLTKKSTPRFVPSVYRLTFSRDSEFALLQILGQKFGAPNRRIIINQKGLKIKTAKITSKQKNKEIEHEVARINHLPTIEEVRLHTSSPLYPGNYEISVEFGPVNRAELSRLEDIDLNAVALRELLPSFDNPEAKAAARIEITS